MDKEELAKAMSRTFALGEIHWQQSDSESTSDWKKADVTLAIYQRHLAETLDSFQTTAAEIDRLRGVICDAHRQVKIALTDGITTHIGIAENILSAALADGEGVGK